MGGNRLVLTAIFTGMTVKTSLIKSLFESVLEDELPTQQTTGPEIDETQAKQLANILASLGISPGSVIAVSEDETTTTTEAKGKKGKKFSLKITPQAIAAAREFYEAGKASMDWYYNASSTLKASFPGNEQDLVLFTLLVAATSANTEIYENFYETIALFNAIKRDIKEHPEELLALAENPVNLRTKFLDSPELQDLAMIQVAKTAKVRGIGAKFGNILRIVKRLLKGEGLSKDSVVTTLAGSVKPTLGVSFNRRDPLLRRLKIANYGLTLLDPEFAQSKSNPFNVVIDTWMFRVFFPEHLSKDVPASSAKASLGKLFASEAAYATVAQTVSALAEEAGISPHQMQAAIWAGIKVKWEEGSGDTKATYDTALSKLVNDYTGFWKDTNQETKDLAGVLSTLDPTPITGALAKWRSDRQKEKTRRMWDEKERVKEREAIQDERGDTSFPFGLDAPERKRSKSS